MKLSHNRVMAHQPISVTCQGTFANNGTNILLLETKSPSLLRVNFCCFWCVCYFSNVGFKATTFVEQNMLCIKCPFAII